MRLLAGISDDQLLKAEGTAPHSVASSLIGQLPSPPTINGDVSEEELRARNVLGIAFAGMSIFVSDNIR